MLVIDKEEEGGYTFLCVCSYQHSQWHAMANHDSADYQLKKWFYVNPVTRFLSCQSVNKWMLHGFVKMDFFKLFHGCVKVVTWICQSRSMYFLLFAKQKQTKQISKLAEASALKKGCRMIQSAQCMYRIFGQHMAIFFNNLPSNRRPCVL